MKNFDEKQDAISGSPARNTERLFYSAPEGRKKTKKALIIQGFQAVKKEFLPACE